MIIGLDILIIQLIGSGKPKNVQILCKVLKEMRLFLKIYIMILLWSLSHCLIMYLLNVHEDEDEQLKHS